MPGVGRIRSLLRPFGVDIVTYRPPTAGGDLDRVLQALDRLRDARGAKPPPHGLAFIEFCAANYEHSRAQLFQDLFVLYELNRKAGGFFVEFGATDGINLSNTFLLEKGYGWQGILAEPAKCWNEALRKNRACRLDFRCVWARSGEELAFNEVPSAEYSTIDSFTSNDLHAKTRRGGARYAVSTVSLESLLRAHDAPREIDYLSIDTEGSELAILSAFDFSRYEIKIISVEHNFTPNREKIHALLGSQGFVRKFEAFSSFDDWYVASGLERQSDR